MMRSEENGIKEQVATEQMGRRTMLTKNLIRQRGWSNTMIDKILGEPDEHKRVRFHRFPLCLYDLERVVTAEQTDNFALLLEKKTKSHSAW